MLSWMAAGLLMLATLAACSPQRTYDVRGRVVGFGDDARTLIVEHEAIPGFMPAMTMSFKTQSDSLPPLHRGDAVGFTFVVTPDAYWIRDVEKLPDDAVARSPASEALGIDTEGARLLEEGDAAPPFNLIRQDGTPLSLSDYEGQVVALTFIYSRCPFPEQCPLLVQRFRSLQPRLKEAFGDQAQLLSISFDAGYDTPEVLRTYAERYTDDFSTWSFATGAEGEIRQLAENYGVYYTAEDEGVYEHNMTTAVIGPDGRVARLWRTNDWSAEDVLSAVAEALEGAEDLSMRGDR